MPIHKVAVIFDDNTRPETTGVYCRRALGTIVEVEHFLPTELSRIPRQGFDLYLNIDDGLEYQLPTDLRPSAWWAIDTHMNFDWCLTKARGFDFVFAAQRDGAEGLRRHGISNASWLPLAADPELHRPFNGENTYDVCFVGNVFPGPRAELIRLIQQHFPNSFVGQRYFDDMAKTYSASKIAFNRSIKNDINMRVFEAMACGAFLLTNDLRDNGQEELFRDGVHLATYHDADELLEKIAYYLSHDEIRQKIALKGREEVLARHTYRHRMTRLLDEVNKGLSAGRSAAQTISATARTRKKRKTQTSKSACSISRSAEAIKVADSASRPIDPKPKKDDQSYPPNDPGYFQFARPELLALIPTEARRILDIGCGAGRLGEAIKKRQTAEVVGIEMVESAARLAKERLDQVLVCDVESVADNFSTASFDVIVCGDVLEHLENPATLLRRARNWLKPDGRLVTSIPNIRHHSVVRSLLKGNWTYESAGLLDRDHLRFFTRREIEKMLFRSGFEMLEMQGILGPGDQESANQAKAGRLDIGSLHMTEIPADQAQEFFIYQYLLVARPEIIPDWGLTSIIIVTHNELSYTQMCLNSIRLFTDEPIELILVDNGSTDGTVEFLDSLPDVKLIRNPQNLGFPKAVNQGIQAAGGKQILLLNNDCIVTTGWLRRMLWALHANPKIGLVGPCSNQVSGEQQVSTEYDDLSDLDGFAWDSGRANDRKLEDTDRLVGFCMLIRRELVDKIGSFDERFGLGCFEDDDFCRRALQAGYRAVIARDAFVHHFGGQTFRSTGVDFSALIQKNRLLFEEKWNEQSKAQIRRDRPKRTPENHGFQLTAKAKNRKQAVSSNDVSSSSHLPYEIRIAKGGGLILVKKEIEISACIIARDNARTIIPCLMSIIPHVDDVILLDTGSKDDTPKIAAALGARVFHFTWCDDFSAARNESIRHARGKWIFWMDSDDTINEENGRMLRLLIRQAPPNVLGFVVSVHCPGAGEDGQFDVTAVSHVKLFRNQPDLRFDGRIHEQILGAIRLAGGDVAWSDAFVTHSGYDHSPEGQKRKLERDLRILHQELKERPEHPFTLFNLGMTYADIQDYQKATDYLHRSLQVSSPKDSHVRKVYALLVQCYKKMELTHVAEETCHKGLERFPLDAELRFHQANLDHDAKRLAQAEKGFENILEVKEESHFHSFDFGILGFKTRQNLAVVYTEMGELKKAETQWRLVVAEKPKYRAGWWGLAENVLQQGRFDDAQELAVQLLQDSFLAVEGLILRSQLASRKGNLALAERDLRRAVDEYPNQTRPLEKLSQFLFENGRVTEAEESLERLVQLDGTNAAAYHNLGTVHQANGRADAAAACYRKSLKYRPHSVPTWFQLGNALKTAGRLEEAIEAWEQGQRLDPSNAEIRLAILEARTLVIT